MNLTLPRVRDFHASVPPVSTPRQLYPRPERTAYLPGIEYDKVDKARGMDITIVTTATTDEEGRDMLKMMGMLLKSIEEDNIHGKEIDART